MYCLWVAIIAVVYSLSKSFYFGDPTFGAVWFVWSFLWGLFFVLLGLKREITRFTGWVTMVLPGSRA